MKTKYTPKEIRGQKYPGYIKISIAQVKRLFEDGQKFDGFIVGNNVSTFHFFGGWHLACRPDGIVSFDEFNNYIDNFLSYLNKELGTRAAIYLKKS